MKTSRKFLFIVYRNFPSDWQILYNCFSQEYLTLLTLPSKIRRKLIKFSENLINSLKKKMLKKYVLSTNVFFQSNFNKQFFLKEIYFRDNKYTYISIFIINVGVIIILFYCIYAYLYKTRSYIQQYINGLSSIKLFDIFYNL